MKSFYGLKYEILNKNNLDVAFKIQKEIWPDNPDYNDLYDKATNTKDDNCFFLVYDKDVLIGITGVDVFREYKETIWLDWFAIIPEYRKMGYGTKVLLDTIEYCKSLNRYSAFRVETTYYESRPALFLYDKIMQTKEDYTIEDTDTVKYNTLIYSYSLKGSLKLWNNKYLGLKDYYDKCSNKLNVILDTDTYNECDDQFALAYMLKNQDIFNIEAITVAPYSHKEYSESIKDGLDNSYNEILKICKWLNFETTNKVFKGAEDYICNGNSETNDAVNSIIEIALRNDKTYIMAIGAITNIALAIKKEPKIIEKIEVIWLGGHSLLQDNNLEFNFKQDIDAVRIVFESEVKLTIIPCKNVASNLRTSIYELNHYLKDKNELCNYLINRFYNDGYHGIQERRVIWDISVIAYMINNKWFTSKEISCPNINDDTSYEMTYNNHKITMINYIDVNKVYSDLFKKLGE